MATFQATSGTPTTTLSYTGTNSGFQVWGATGDDQIFTSSTVNGNDTIYGNSTGYETIYTYGGNDNVYAGDGDDYVDAGTGSNTVYGGNGNDFIWAGSETSVAGTNSLYGEEGNDIIFSNGTNDTLDGGNGNDWLYAVQEDLFGSNPTLKGGAGKDRLMATNGTMTGGSDADLFMVMAGAGSVTITDFQDGVDNFLLPKIDSTYLATQVGSDTQLTLDGDVVALLKNVSASTITLSDFAYESRGAALGLTNFKVIDPPRVTTVPALRWSFNSPSSSTLWSSTMTTPSSSTTYTVWGTQGYDQIGIGSGGATHLDETIWTFGGDDWVNLADGNDVVYGGTGNDILEGDGEQTLALYGGKGDDKLTAAHANAVTISGESGNDSIRYFDYHAANTGTVMIDGGNGNDVIECETNITNPAKIVNIFGGSGNDQIYSEKGSVTGGGGSDIFKAHDEWLPATIVNDYQDGIDKIAICNEWGREPITNMRAIQVGADAEIHYGNNAAIMILKNTQASSINTSDYILMDGNRLIL